MGEPTLATELCFDNEWRPLDTSAGFGLSTVGLGPSGDGLAVTGGLGSAAKSVILGVGTLALADAGLSTTFVAEAPTALFVLTRLTWFMRCTFNLSD